MKLQIHKCDECGHIIMNDEDVIILNSVSIGTGDGSSVHIQTETDKKEFCGPGCLIKNLNTTLTKEVGVCNGK